MGWVENSVENTQIAVSFVVYDMRARAGERVRHYELRLMRQVIR